MSAVLRLAGGIAAGLVLAFVLVVAVEGVSAVVHPVPPDFGGTEEEMCAHIERYPAWVLAVVVPAWAGTACLGTWLAGRIGGWVSALVVGLLLFAAVAANVSMLPYPSWFKVATLLAIPAAVAGGVYLTRRRREALQVAV